MGVINPHTPPFMERADAENGYNHSGTSNASALALMGGQGACPLAARLNRIAAHTRSTHNIFYNCIISGGTQTTNAF